MGICPYASERNAPHYTGDTCLPLTALHGSGRTGGLGGFYSDLAHIAQGTGLRYAGEPDVTCCKLLSCGSYGKSEGLFGDLLQDGKVSEDAFWSYVEIREQLKELKPLMEVTQSLDGKTLRAPPLLYEAEYSLSRRQYSAALAQLDELRPNLRGGWNFCVL